jgi:hypothetical protein
VDSIQASTAGAYTCSLKPGVAAPFVIVATDPAGVADPLVSLVADTPTTGSKTTANVTPLTHAIAAMLAPNRNPLMLVPAAGTGDADRAARKAALSNAASNLPGQVKALVAQLKDVLTQAGVTDVAGFNPFSTPFVARSAAGKGDPGDVLLDIVRIEPAVATDGSPSLAMSNRFGTAPPVLIAAAGTASPPTITATAGGFSIAELDFARNQMEKCFAVPSTSRVTSTGISSNGFNSVRTSAPACDGFTSTAAKTGAGTDFKQDGYTSSEFFYGLLTSSDMDGATFNLPELMRYITRGDGRDEAVLNIKFRDKNGNVGKRILLAKKFPGSDAASGRAAGTDWWLFGNQRPVEVYVSAMMERVQQFAPNAGVSGTFQYREKSHFSTGLDIYINRFGPGSTNLRYVRVKGAGLPDNGLVFAQQTVFPGSGSISWMSVLNKSGVIPTGAQQFSNTGNLFRLQRSNLDGSAYDMPNQSGNNTQTNFAHPADYGKVMPTGNFVDFGTMPSWTSYTFELFNGTDTTPSIPPFTVPIVTPVATAATGLAQQWHDWSANSLQYLNPDIQAAAVQQPKFDFNLLLNPYAERVTSLGVYTHGKFTVNGLTGSNTNVSQGFTNVAPGQTAVSVVAPTDAGGPGVTAFPALTSDGDARRQFQMRHQRLDGSSKFSFHRFN